MAEKLEIEKNSKYAESSVTIIGLTRHYGTPQYILVSSDNGDLKFPGLRYRAARSEHETLEDIAKARFEEQTGLKMNHNLGLRVIMPTRSRHRNQWIFRYLFLGVVDDLSKRNETDRERNLYVADVGRGIRHDDVEVAKIGDSKNKTRMNWVIADNREVAQVATDLASRFDWNDYETDWYRRIPCVGAEPQTNSDERPLGCGLAVASMVLLYKPDIGEPFNVLTLKRKEDDKPGHGGGKIETPESKNNLDPISCCMAEGTQETGFPIRASAIICCAHTALNCQNDEGFYAGIDNLAFVAEPVNPNDVREALKNPSAFLEEKMESYCAETMSEYRDRVDRGDLRMPDMIAVGREFFRTTPGQKIPLTQIRASGVI